MFQAFQRGGFKWERGRANPTYDNLIQLAEIFGVSLDEVAGRKTSA